MIKIIFVGLGSIGQRHLKNLIKLLDSEGKLYNIEALRNTTKPLPKEVENVLSKQYTKMDELPNDYDIAFITNPTFLHYQSLREIAIKTKNIFVEKPVFENSKYNIQLLQLKKDTICYIACPLRYTQVIQYLKTFLDGKKVYSVRAICSTYLPEWRPNVDYRTTYSAKKEQGGGVSIDLIHEWDYLCYLFGFPEKVFNIAGKYSDLEISSDDLSVYIGQYPDKIITLHLDYFGRKARREIEIYLENDVIVGDLVANQIRILKEDKVIQFDGERDTFQMAELKYFMDIIEGRKENHNDLMTAIKVLEITEGDNNT